jgi:hypothetical protein
MASIPFSYGMSNITSQFSSSIPATNTNPSIGLGGMAPLHIPFSFGGAHIPQTTPTVGIQPPFHPGSNPSPNAPRWSGQLSGEAHVYVTSFTPTPSKLIPANKFGMTNPPLSSGFPPRGGHFHTLGNPQPGATSARGNIYKPHYNIPTGMVPNQPLMNQFGWGFSIPNRAMVHTRTLDGLRFSNINLLWELGARCHNPVSLFWCSPRKGGMLS